LRAGSKVPRPREGGRKFTAYNIPEQVNGVDIHGTIGAIAALDKISLGKALARAALRYLFDVTTDEGYSDLRKRELVKAVLSRNMDKYVDLVKARLKAIADTLEELSPTASPEDWEEIELAAATLLKKARALKSRGKAR
jgi:hypothetical protein